MESNLKAPVCNDDERKSLVCSDDERNFLRERFVASYQDLFKTDMPAEVKDMGVHPYECCDKQDTVFNRHYVEFLEDAVMEVLKSGNAIGNDSEEGTNG